MSKSSTTITNSNATNNIKTFAPSSPKSNEQRVIQRTFYIPPVFEEEPGLTSHENLIAELTGAGFGEVIRSGRKMLGQAMETGTPSLRTLRLRAGLSQSELAELAGLEQYQISRYEGGKDRPSAPAMEKLKRHLAVDIDTLWTACGYEE